MRKWMLLAGVLLVFGLLLTGCGGGGATQAPIVIGYIGDFNGMWAPSEAPTRDGAQFAVDEINKAGGVLGRQLQLVAKDGQDDNALTVRLTQEVIDGGAVYIIGTVGNTVVAEGKVACKAGVPFSTGIGSAPNLVTDIGDCSFTVIFNDTIQAAAEAQYAYEQGYRTAYMLRSNEFPYVQKLPDYFKETFERKGGKVTGEEEFRTNAGDYAAIVTTIANLKPPPDVIYSPMINPDSVLFMRQLRAAGVTIPVYTPDTNDAPNILDGGKAVEGMLVSTHGFPVPGSKLSDFYDSYEKAKGKRPDTIFYALGYDEVYAVKKAIETAGSANRPAVLKAVLNLKDFQGITGSWSMDPKTRLAAKPVTLITIKDGKFSLVKSFYPDYVPAP